MAKAPDNPSPISPDSTGYMEEVKKGKPRKFAMICKGNAVVSLVVYKKGNVEKYKKEAKETGKGQFYFGVVDGKGMDIRFALARSDGFEDAPLKNAALKGFLEESADLKCKPYFEIVDVPPFALDTDDPLVARFLALQARGIQSGESHPDRAAEIKSLCLQIASQLDQDQPDQAKVNLDTLETLLNSLGSSSNVTPTKPNDDLAAKLIEALKNLKPLLEKVVAAHPSRKAELINSFTQIRDEIKNQQLPQAQAHFDDLNKLLQSLVGSPSVSTSGGESPVSEEMALWKAKIAEWGPAIKTAIAAKGPNAAEIRKLLDQASALSKPGGILSEAIAKLTECYALATAGPSEVDPGAQFNLRLKSLLSAIKAAIGTPAGDEAKSLAGEAVALAGKKDFGSANSILDRVQDLLSNNFAPSQSSIPKPAPSSSSEGGQPEDSSSGGLLSTKVVFTQARLLYDNARKQAQAELQRFIIAACAEFEEEPIYDAIAAEIRKLSMVLDGFDERLIDKLDEAYNAKTDVAEKSLHSQAKSIVDEYQSFLAQNKKLFQVLDSNPFTPVQIETLLRDTLSNLAIKLA